MKKFRGWALCLFVGLLATSCATIGVPPNGTDNQELSGEIELTVYGLSCPLCASNLDQHLQRLPGINEMWPDLETGAVRLTLKEGHTLPASAFGRAVRDAGFTMQSVTMVEDSP